MTTKIEVPTLGESISEATVAQWLKSAGDFVQEDELIAELETDKVNLEVTAPKAGKLSAIMTEEGATVTPGDIMGEIDESATGGDAAPAEAAAEETPAAVEAKEAPVAEAADSASANSADKSGPAAKKMIAEKGVDAATVTATGKDGRVTKGDVVNHLKGGGATASASTTTGEKNEERVPLPRIRKTISKRLKRAQNTAAMLTTYNEIDLYEVMQLRKKHQDAFVEKYGVKLGFMSLFTKATVEALKDWPALNSEIDGEELVTKHYYDIGIAVGSPKGLVVPVVRGADKKNFADIELEIKNFAGKAKDGKLMPDEMVGATFSITNGGTFGSMLSMPILNYPQAGILGMHAIKERPVVVNGEVKVRPVMYVALTYDHRIVDGREAVSFLVKIKECLENPERMLLGV